MIIIILRVPFSPSRVPRVRWCNRDVHKIPYRKPSLAQSFQIIWAFNTSSGAPNFPHSVNRHPHIWKYK